MSDLQLSEFLAYMGTLPEGEQDFMAYIGGIVSGAIKNWFDDIKGMLFFPINDENVPPTLGDYGLYNLLKYIQKDLDKRIGISAAGLDIGPVRTGLYDRLLRLTYGQDYLTTGMVDLPVRITNNMMSLLVTSRYNELVLYYNCLAAKMQGNWLIARDENDGGVLDSDFWNPGLCKKMRYEETWNGMTHIESKVTWTSYDMNNPGTWVRIDSQSIVTPSTTGWEKGFDAKTMYFDATIQIGEKELLAVLAQIFNNYSEETIKTKLDEPGGLYREWADMSQIWGFKTIQPDGSRPDINDRFLTQQLQMIIPYWIANTDIIDTGNQDVGGN